MAPVPLIEEPPRTDLPAARYHYYMGVVQITVACLAFIFSFFGCIFREEYSVFGNGFYIFVFLLPPGIFGYMAGTRESQWHLARAFSLSLIASVACAMDLFLCSMELTFLVPQYSIYIDNFYMAVLRITRNAGEYQIAKTILLILGCLIGGVASIIQTILGWRDLQDPSRLKRYYHGAKRHAAVGQIPYPRQGPALRYVHPPEAHMIPSGEFGRSPEVVVAKPATGGGYRAAMNEAV